MQPADKSPEGATGTTLEELERFRQDIERYRARRKAVSEEFEGFVRGFKATPRAPAVPAPPVEAPHPPVGTPRPAVETPRPTVAMPRPAPAPLPVPSAAEPPRVSVPPAPQLEPAQSIDVGPDGSTSPRRSWIPLAIGALVIIVLAAWWLSRTPADVSDAAPAMATATAPAPQPAPAPAAPPADPSESVLTTTRPVWLRVVADGARVVNRELPGGARVPFKAEKVIEIRAGDAGAVRLSIGGRDQGPLGADGAVVTRSFTVQR